MGYTFASDLADSSLSLTDSSPYNKSTAATFTFRAGTPLHRTDGNDYR